MSYNLSEANGGHIALNSSALVIGASATAIAVTSTVTLVYAFNGILRTVVAFTNTTPTMLPAATGSGTYNTQFPARNLGPSQKMMCVICVDYNGALYMVQGATVENTLSAPPPPYQGMVDPVSSSGVVSNVSNSFTPQFTSGLTPFAAIVVSTNATTALQFQTPAPTLPVIGGITNAVAFVAAGITTVVYQLVNWPSNAL